MTSYFNLLRLADKKELYHRKTIKVRSENEASNKIAYPQRLD